DKRREIHQHGSAHACARTPYPAGIAQHQQRQRKQVAAMYGCSGGVSSKCEREKEQHLQAFRKAAQYICREPMEAMLAKVAEDEAKMICGSIRADFGRETVRQIQNRVECEGYGKE